MVFNPFRLIGDAVHFSAKAVLLYRAITSHDCKGISMRTQLMYVLLFVCRYLDLLTVFVSWYNALMKGVYIAVSVVVCAVLHMKSSRQPAGLQELDDFKVWKIILPSLVLSLIPVYMYFRYPSVPAVMEFLWYFSITLEAVAMVPQYVVMHRLQRDTDRGTMLYIVLQGSYRGFYILNWILRRVAQPWYWMPYLWACGVLQFSLFCVYYFTWWNKRYLHHAKAPTLAEVSAEELEDVQVMDALLPNNRNNRQQQQQAPQQSRQQA